MRILSSSLRRAANPRPPYPPENRFRRPSDNRPCHHPRRDQRPNSTRRVKETAAMTQPFTHQIRVRWGEVDAQGVVFNAHYLVYADVVGTEYYRHLGVLDANIEDLLQVYVVDARLSFKSPALNDDLLTCTVQPTRIGGSSFELTITITRDTTVLTEIRMTYVRAIDGQSARLSDAFRALIS